MFNILSHKGSAYQKDTEIPSHSSRTAIIKKTNIEGDSKMAARGRKQKASLL
jgi:hypothetical protein